MRVAARKQGFVYLAEARVLTYEDGRLFPLVRIRRDCPCTTSFALGFRARHAAMYALCDVATGNRRPSA